MSRVRRLFQRVRRAYHLRCAREDARQHGLAVPLGVWVCDCRHVALDKLAFLDHMVEVHA